MDIDFGHLGILALVLIGMYIAYEFLFWFMDALLFKAILGGKDEGVPRLIVKLRKTGYRLAFVSIMLGFGLTINQQFVAGAPDPHIVIEWPWVQLGIGFLACSTVLFWIGKWWRKVEIRNL
jgi:hypothetical protein